MTPYYYVGDGKRIAYCRVGNESVHVNGLTNAGVLMADESLIRYSRLFCTRWNGLDKASRIVDALDDREFSGSLVLLLQKGMGFVKIIPEKWMKTGSGRVELPDYGEQVC